MKRSAALALVLLAAVACKKPTAAPGPDETPPGQVWLTDAQMQKSNVQFGEAQDRSIQDSILASGRVTFDDARVQHVFSPVSGRVQRIMASLGDHVKKGDPLAVIESPDVGIASAELAKAQAEVVAAEHEMQRQKELAKVRATSERDVERAEDEYRKAQAELERAKQKALLLRAGNVDRVSQTYTLLAGIDGEVISRTLTPGTEVQGQYGGGTAAELFTLGELGKVWVVADIYEMDLARVKVGTRASVTVIAHQGKRFDGAVDYVAGTLDPQTRTIKVRATFDNKERLLLPEMYATVRLFVEEKTTLAIPRRAVVRMGEQTVVFLESGKTNDGRTKLERVPVAVDEGEGDEWVSVKHGLSKGQRVVVNGAVLLSGAL